MLTKQTMEQATLKITLQKIVSSKEFYHSTKSIQTQFLWKVPCSLKDLTNAGNVWLKQIC